MATGALEEGAWPVDALGRFALLAPSGPAATGESLARQRDACSHAYFAKLEREFGVIDGRKVDTTRPLPLGSIPPPGPPPPGGRKTPKPAKGSSTASLAARWAPAGPMFISTAMVSSLTGPEFVSAILNVEGLDDSFFAVDDPNTLAALAEPRVQEVVAGIHELLSHEPADFVINALSIHQGLYFLRAASYVDSYSTSLDYSAAMKASVASLVAAVGNYDRFFDPDFLMPRNEWCVVMDSWGLMSSQVDRIVDVFRYYLETPEAQTVLELRGRFESQCIYALFYGMVRTAETDAGWHGSYTGALMEVIEDYAVHFDAPVDVEFLVLNAIYALGHLRANDPVAAYRGRAHQILTAAYRQRTPHKAPYLETLTMLEASPFLSRFADGTPININAYREQLKQIVFSNTFTYDGGAMVFHTPLASDVVARLYDGLRETKAQFFRLTQALRPADNDSNTVLHLRIYASRSDYDLYQRFLYGLDTNNGGVYIEGTATFFTFERTVMDSSYTLEEIARHEYTHYLDAFYLLTPRFGDAPFYSNDRLTWHSEGLAEFMAGSRRTQGVVARANMLFPVYQLGLRMTIADIIGARYSSGFDFYPNAALFFQFLHEENPEKLWRYFRTLYTNSVTAYDALTQPWRSDAALQSRYDDFLEDMDRGFRDGSRLIAENVPTDYKPATLPPVTVAEIGSALVAASGTGAITAQDSRFRFERTEQVSVPGASQQAQELFQRALSASVDETLSILTPQAAHFGTTTAWFELLSFSGQTANVRVTYEGWYQPKVVPSLISGQSELAFDSVVGDETNQILSLVVTNTGASALQISDITIAGDGGRFFGVVGTATSQSVAGGGSATVKVRVNAAEVGNQSTGPFDAVLTIHTANGDPATMEIPLRVSRARTLFVDRNAPVGGDGSSWARAVPRIGVALVRASTGKEAIFVADGVYAEAIQLRQSVRVYGGFSGYGAGEEQVLAQRRPEEFVTVLSGALAAGTATHVVSFVGANTALLDGFTVTGGWAQGTTGQGGGISLAGNGTVRRCVIDRNRAGAEGGGVFLSSGNAVMEDCVISGNVARYGGGIGIKGTAFTKLTLRRCLVAGNETTGTGAGGGVRVDGGTLEASSCFFLGNRGDYGGGGFSLSGSGTSFALRSSLVAGNRAGSFYGGGEVGNYATFNAEHCVFYRNIDGASMDGLGIFYGASATLRNCIFAGHTVALGIGWGTSLGTLNARHCLFFGNEADYTHPSVGSLTGAASLNAQSSVFIQVLSGDPQWRTTPAGPDITSAVYDSGTATTTLTVAGEGLVAGALNGALLDKGSAEAVAVRSNTTDTIVVYGHHDSLSAWSSWRPSDFHLTVTSPAIDRGMAGTEAIDPDRFPRGLDLAAANGAGNGTDIGMYEFAGTYNRGNLLGLQPQSGQIRLAWPASLSAWQAYRSANLVDWEPVPVVRTVSGGELIMVVPQTFPAQYFRLVKP